MIRFNGQKNQDKNNELTGGEEKSVADDTGGFSLSTDNTLLYHLLFLPRCSRDGKSRAFHLKKSDVNFYEISRRAAAPQKSRRPVVAVFL